MAIECDLDVWPLSIPCIVANDQQLVPCAKYRLNTSDVARKTQRVNLGAVQVCTADLRPVVWRQRDQPRRCSRCCSIIAGYNLVGLLHSRVARHKDGSYRGVASTIKLTRLARCRNNRCCVELQY